MSKFLVAMNDAEMNSVVGGGYGGAPTVPQNVVLSYSFTQTTTFAASASIPTSIINFGDLAALKCLLQSVGFNMSL